MFKRLYNNFSWFIHLYRRPYAFALIFLVINYALSLVPPWMVGTVADGLIGGDLQLGGFVRLIILLLLTVGALYGVNYLWNVRLLKAGDEIARVSRQRLMERFRRQGPKFYSEHSVGSLLGKSTNDVVALTNTAGYAVMALCDAAMQPLALILIMGIQVSWKMTFFSLLPLPLVMVLSLYVGKKMYPLYDQAQVAFDEMNSMVLDNVSGVRVVRAYGRQQQQIDAFAEESKRLYKSNMKVVRYSVLFPVISKLIPGFSYAIALAMGGFMVSSGQISAGDMVSFIIYLDMMVWPMFALGDFINVAQMGVASMERIQELLDEPFDVVDRPDAVPYDTSSDIEFRQFNFTYPGAEDATLKNISFKLKEGQTLGIVGCVGAGKSTLLKQFLRYYPLNGEHILLGGKPLQNYQIASLRSRIGYCSQQPFLFSASIKENILFGNMPPVADATARLEEVVDLADLRKDLMEMPRGIETRTGEKGVTLSGGQRQRICIARALFKNPDILILDDSLSAVDATTETHILERLQAERKGKTTLISAHRLSCVMHADWILVLDDGSIRQQGTHDMLLENDSWYRKQYYYQLASGGEMRNQTVGGGCGYD